MKTLHIIVANKVASYLQRDGYIVCGNSDYQIEFSFDSEWDAYARKTARFIWDGKYKDVVFSGKVCPVPIIANTVRLEVGVYAEDICTTTSALITCKKSIRCNSNVISEGTVVIPDVAAPNLCGIEVTPTKDYQNIVPEGECDGFDEVIVNPIPEEYITASEMLPRIITGSITDISDDNVSTVGDYALYKQSALKSASFPNVISIGDSAFAACEALTTIDAPNATHIGAFAFERCTALNEISFDAMESIGEDAFWECTSLPTKITLTKAKTIGEYAFAGCSSIVEIDAPEAITISENAFHSNTSLSKVSLPNITTIEASVFLNCTVLDESGIDLSNIVEIGDSALSICGFKTVNMPKLSTMGSSGFSACQSLTSVTAPLLEAIPNNGFINCYALKTVEAPNVKSLGSSAFRYCESLEEVYFPLVTSVDNYCFSNTPKLTKIDLPKLTSISYYGLAYCYALTTLILRSPTVCTLANKAAFNNSYHYTGGVNSTYNPEGLKDGYIYVPKALIESYKKATNWSTYASQFRAIEDYPDICDQADNLITFTIEGTTYQAEEGMLWWEWAESDYDTDGFMLAANVYFPNGIDYIDAVTPYDEIVNGGSYYKYKGNHSGGSNE